jgi:hypothetical protein
MRFPEDDIDLQDDAEEGRVLNEDGSVTYTLVYPVGALVVVTLRRPKGADLEASDKGTSVTARDCLIVSRLGKVDLKVIEEEMDAYDLGQLKEIVQDLMKNPPPGVKARDIVFNADGSAVVPLAVPRMSEGSELEEITLRRPKPVDLKVAAEFNGGAAGRSNLILARLADVPKSTIRALDGFDHARLNQVASDFLQKRPSAGARPSSS